MAKRQMTREREQQILYLLNRAYPRKLNGTRAVGNQEFYAELCEQPDNVLETLVASAREEQENRRSERQREKLA